jgi:phospholipase C
MNAPTNARCLALVILSFFVTSCTAGGVSPSTPNGASPPGILAPEAKAHSGPIKHIILLVQENRSFDNLFATFPGANGATSGKTHDGKTIQLTIHSLTSLDVSHDYNAYETDYDSGNMDGFDLAYFIHSKTRAGTYPYQYVNPSAIKPYWTLAQQYALADAMFQTQGSGSFTAHQDLIAGTTALDSTHSVIDSPLGSPWGCDAPPSTKTSLITTDGQYQRAKGPFPCWNYPTGTLRDLLDAKGVTWKYYAPAYKAGGVGALWNAFAAIQPVRQGPEWQSNISIPETNILNDIKNNQLPKLSWVIPDQLDSDHPGTGQTHDDGPSWIAQVVNAVGGSSYWKSSAIIVVWDDWGGFYDHVPPAFLDDMGGLGFRVPMVVVSPYIPQGTISHTQYEFGSILKFIEQTFALGSLGTTDARATSIGDIFNLSQTPRPFKPIASLRSRNYFLHRAPSLQPVDTE